MYINHFTQWRNGKEAEGREHKGGEGGSQEDGKAGKELALNGQRE